MKINISKALQRLKKRTTKKNRYDKFSENFYIKAQKAFIKIAKNKKKYYIFDSSEDDKNLEKSIFKLVHSKLIK